MGPAHRPDVLVAGGGAAGVAAAVGAARAGARVVLLERQGFLGGMATAALVGTVCGLYVRSATRPGTWAVGGFARELAERLAASSDTVPVRWREGLQFLPYAPLAFRRLCDEVLLEAGVETWLHATVLGVARDGRRIAQVRACGWDREVVFEPGAVVDTTGTAWVSACAGAPLREEGPHQAPAWVFAVAGLPPVDPLSLKLGLGVGVRRGIESGRLPDALRAVSVVPGSHLEGRCYLKLGLVGTLAGEPLAVAEREREARALAGMLVEHLRTEVEGFQHVAVTDMAAQVGVRTGRRPVGRATLREEDVLQARRAADEVAAGAWPIEHWGDAPEPVLRHLPEGRTYGIGAGTLEAADVDGLFVAGRMLSADDGAVGSARVIGTCLATGYAAGTLAEAAASGRDRPGVLAALKRLQVVHAE
ncbi:MAG: FAD-dependent oxidoreductase [Alphaproteobacteria bacterium]|nr:FAD-dependent oxidoreductase [Alphaproteobacteria bacterium]